VPRKVGLLGLGLQYQIHQSLFTGRAELSEASAVYNREILRFTQNDAFAV